jgi:hypothetical protein
MKKEKTDQNPSDFRCCMCPNGDAPIRKICPPGGPQNKPESLCRFVATFQDETAPGFLFPTALTQPAGNGFRSGKRIPGTVPTG